MPYQSTLITRRHLGEILGEGRREIIRTQERSEPLYAFPQRVKPVVGYFVGRTEVVVFHSQVQDNFLRVLVEESNDVGWIDVRQFTFEEVEKPAPEPVVEPEPTEPEPEEVAPVDETPAPAKTTKKK